MLLNISMLTNTNVIINGRDSYFSRSVDECDNLSPMAAPGPSTYQYYLLRPSLNTAYMLCTNFGAFNSKIYKSTNDCGAWTSTFDSIGLNINLIRAFDNNEVIAYTYNYETRTKNGGNSWTTIPNYAGLPQAVEVFGDSTIVLCSTSGGAGAYKVSNDRGNTWLNGTNFGGLSDGRDFCFLSKDTIFGVSSKGFWGPFIVKTYNGGANWIKDTLPNYNPHCVYFKSKVEGYVLGQLPNGNGVILKTTDLGQSWSSFDTQIKTLLMDIKFLNDSIALVSGTSGILLKWNTKQTVFVGAKNNFLDKHFISFSPNPVKDKLKLDVSEIQSSDLKYSISNALGQHVYPETFLLPSQEIDMSGFPTGIYFLKIQNPSDYRAYKIIKE